MNQSMSANKKISFIHTWQEPKGVVLKTQCSNESIDEC